MEPTNNGWITFVSKFIIESEKLAGITPSSDEEVARDITWQRSEGVYHGHVGALLRLGGLVTITNHYVSGPLICEINKLIAVEGFVDGTSPQSPKTEVSERIESVLGAIRWFARVQWWQENLRFGKEPMEKVCDVANFYYDFVRAKPFASANGRTARALAYFLLLQGAVNPFIFYETGRASHDASLSEPTARQTIDYFLWEWRLQNSNTSPHGCRHLQ
ncbi:MAG: Fic family protein [bacterium]|nr:Fic family protein [bacterium]